MFIPVTISLIIITAILSFGLSFSVLPIKSSDFFGFFKKEEGRVLGMAEASLNESSELMLEKTEEVGRVVAKVADEIKNTPPIISEVLLAEELLESDGQVGPKRLAEAGVYEVKARAASVIDYESDVLLFNHRTSEIVPIASITKLMTALVFLDFNPGWDFIYEIKEEDRREGGKVYLYWGEKVKVKDLFYLSLVSSANTATIALVHSTGLSEVEFVEKMNEKAQELGLVSTVFSDPVGLNSNNVSTAWEVAKLAKTVLAHKDIRQATLTKTYEFKTLSGKEKKVYTTDYLLDNFPQNGIKIIGGKTGYTEAAGYCFVGQFVNEDGWEIISVVLGSQGYKDRFEQTKYLVEWVYESYEWQGL